MSNIELYKHQMAELQLKIAQEEEAFKRSGDPRGPLKLDLGCGNGERKNQGFTGVDAFPRDGVDVVHDLTVAPWPWEDNSVDEVWCSHTLEHIPALDRITFFNELWRVMKPGAKATIITPHWASCRAYGDVTHQWPPVSEMFWYSLDPAWRKLNQPHLSEGSKGKHEFECHFACAWSYAPAQWLQFRNQEFVSFALNAYKEAAQDMICTINKVKMDPPVLTIPQLAK